ncbi:splicing factor, suppressor of white-apricot isoform X1 [Cinnamomum micranthum f. kanehirae]|uniref:Splicing factor, suppressor of white-apricot isoform X1 n=1 Tax=Cinnamomum micranthum f. kanehirae TaxID=337451 RepID=A0A443Q2U5_9MAGN|nr:splicing factor, suppressor of white-apricot isoform X1 [Cinnamomum micranthum f. kanehirae]
MVDLEVAGRHALLFDDDAMAAFVNSSDALLQWNSLLIDRYDVRHLLQDLPPPVRKPRRPAPLLEPDGVHRSDLDSERYQDLPLNGGGGGGDENPHSEPNRLDLVASGNYQAVSFSYGNTDASSEAKNFDSGLGYSGFHPPFPVPESLLKNLPPTEKVHQIMARTAKFVREHGGQSEIVLRVKQGDNPTFGFLMPDHHLHEYFRFLVDHKELLQTETDVKPSKEEKKVSSGKNQIHVEGGALSLLGSLYGYGEDEDGTLHVASETKEIESGNSVDAVNVTSSHGPDRVESSVVLAKEDAGAAKHSSAAAVNEKASLAKRGSRAIDTSSGTKSGKKRQAETSSSPSSSLCFSEDKPQLTQKPSMFEVEPLIVDPPPFLKKIIDQTVEFIQKNGKEFEAVLIKQDTTQGKFQFLLPSNHYHPYYLKLLQKAQESKLLGKRLTQKLDLQGHKNSKERVQDMGMLKGNDKALSKGFTSVPKTSTELQGAYDSERKEKFRMVIGGSKKDNVDPHSKPAQRQGGVTVDEAAAIVRAASRGHMNTKVDSLLKASFNDSGKGLGIGDDGRTSSTGSFSFSCHAHSSASKPTSNGEQGFLKSGELPLSVQQSDKGGKSSDVSVAKAIAKTVALAAATEADSSEVSLTREQKQKAERLKRAKMFAAMIKGGGGGSQGASESLPHLSMQATGSALSGSMECVSKVPFERAGSVPVAAVAVSNLLNSEFGDPMSGEREGSSVPIDVNVLDKVERKTYSDDVEGGDDRERKRKKHSSRSRRHVDSDEDSKRSRKKHRSERSSHHGRDDHRHRKSHSSNKDREHRHRHRHRHHSSSADEHGHKNRSDKHRRSHAERELEEGELVSEHSNSIEVEGNAGKTPNDPREGSLPSVSDNRSSDATEVPAELRAKVRAMLLATM